MTSTHATPSASTPSLMREMNVRAALSLLVEKGPLSRTELAGHAGLSKVTSGQLLSRLADLGLVEVVGARASTRGPQAEVYGVVAAAAYVVGVDVRAGRLQAVACDLLGAQGPAVSVRVPTRGPRSNPVAAVAEAVDAALAAAGTTRDRLRGVGIAVPGLVEPASGDVSFSYDLTTWRKGVRAELEDTLSATVTIDNDANLAAVAEHREGVAVGSDDFVLLWVGRGIGSAIVLNGEVRRGASGAAGELGYLPVPGVELPRHISRRDKGAFQRLAGEEALVEVAATLGVAAADVESAVAQGHPDLVAELSHRLAVGVAAVCAVVDPGLVVLTGPLARAGGTVLGDQVAESVATIAPVHPRVVVSQAGDGAVLRGAVLVALDTARVLVSAG